MEAVAIGESVPGETRNEETGQVAMRVIRVLKGDQWVKPDETVSVVYYGDLEPGRRYMLSGADPPNLLWSCLPLTPDSEAYLLKVAELPDDPLERLKFYQGYLQHSDSMLTRDSYDEFATTPYPVVQALKPFMNHDELVAWISEPEMPADRKRLYLTMLGVCGDEKDLPMLEKMLRSTQPSTRAGLDALIAAYLILAGESGLPLINELFLANHQSSYADTYAAIMAIRFHGTEADKIPRSSLVQSLHLVLEREDLADLVIPDLARWGDWSQIDRLVQLFTEAEDDNNWVRVPVVNYLRACPKPEAEAALEKLREIDPESVRRASSFFSIPIPTPGGTPNSSQRTRGRDWNWAVLGGAYPRTEEALAASVPLRALPARSLPLTADGRYVSRSDPAIVNFAGPVGVTLMAFASLAIAMYLVVSGGGTRVVTPV